MLNCGPKPRAVTTAPSPLRRSMETPVIRCSASLRFVSGKFADVFGVDGVDHADRVALGLHRGLETAAQSGDHDLLQFLALRFLLLA